jgi:hypothetical protein
MWTLIFGSGKNAKGKVQKGKEGRREGGREEYLCIQIGRCTLLVKTIHCRTSRNEWQTTVIKYKGKRWLGYTKNELTTSLFHPKHMFFVFCSFLVRITHCGREILPTICTACVNAGRKQI